MTAAMTSTSLQSDVHTPISTNLQLLTINGDSWLCFTNLDISLDIHLLDDLSRFLNVCMVLKNYYRVHVKDGKSVSVPPSDNLRMRTEILHFTMQKISPDV